MPVRESEAFVLRTYPYREADLIVSFVSRDQGKLRGVARRARRPKNSFGSGLERLAHVRLFYFQRDNRDLVRLDRSELLEPPLFLRADYVTGVALDYIAEVCDRLLPEQEPSDAFFRLVVLVLEQIRSGLEGVGVGVPSSSASTDMATNGSPATASAQAAESAAAGTGGGEARLWAALTYFSLWAVRLGGWLPPLDVCIQSGATMALSETAYFERAHPGLFSADFRGPNAWAISAASRRIANQMLKTSLRGMETAGWSADTAADLRRFLNQRLEDHGEGRLKTARVLEELGKA